MRLKELRVIWEKSGMQPLEYSRKVYFGVFHAWMVAIQKKCANRQTGPNPEVFAPEMRRCQSSASVGTPSLTTARIYAASSRSCLSCRNRKCPSPLFCSRYCSVTPTTPSPYRSARRKLIEDASGKYFVGQETSPIRYPK